MTENEKKLLDWVLENPDETVTGNADANALVVAILEERVTPECQEFVKAMLFERDRARVWYSEQLKLAKQKWGHLQVESAMLRSR